MINLNCCSSAKFSFGSFFFCRGKKNKKIEEEEEDIYSYDEIGEKFDIKIIKDLDFENHFLSTDEFLMCLLLNNNDSVISFQKRDFYNNKKISYDNMTYRDLSDKIPRKLFNLIKKMHDKTIMSKKCLSCILKYQNCDFVITSNPVLYNNKCLCSVIVQKIYIDLDINFSSDEEEDII